MKKNDLRLVSLCIFFEFREDCDLFISLFLVYSQFSTTIIYFFELDDNLDFKNY